MSHWIERMAHMSHRTPSDPASQPEHNRTMLERVRQNVRRLVNQATPRHIHANPFGKALDKPDDIVDELTRNAIRLLEMYDYPRDLIAEAYEVQEKLTEKSN